jgi:thiol-disulfide isomerase/thioredoxin
VKITLKDGVHYLEGVLDEFAEFKTLKSDSEKLILNVGKIARVNSVGIRNFVEFLQSWFPKPVEYHEARPHFVANLNGIPQILGGLNNHSKVVSVFVPFYCEHCKAESEHLYESEEIAEHLEASETEFPIHQCPKCKHALDPDFIPGEYFEFLNR